MPGKNNQWQGIMTAQERLQWLTQQIKSDSVSTGDKLKACDQMNKMLGEYGIKADGSPQAVKLEDLL